MIKTWQQRCEEHPDHNGIVSEGMIQARMQEEIDELRAAIEQAKPISNPDGLNQELLEALKELLRCPAGDYDTTDDYENAVKRARAAIEQARLEQHEQAMKDAIIGGTGVMLGNKRIDPASIYKQPEQDPRRWEDQETCHCDSPTWCKHYNKCNRKMLGLPPAPRQWQGLTDAEIKAPIQRAMQHFGYDPTQYSLGGMATIGFYGLVKEIEAKLREKNT